jgi:DNA modification methylase
MADMTWHTEQRRLGELIEWDKNPRKLSKQDAEQLRKSIAGFGIVDPFIINTNNRLIGGHQRKKVMVKDGCSLDTLVDVRVPSRELTERELEELAIRLNRNTGEWDFNLLEKNFNKDDLVTWGFSIDDLLFDDNHITADPGPKLDQADELLEKWKVQPGQIWGLGDHRLICGDSTDRLVVDRLAGGEPLELMVTDPPYGVKYDPSWRIDAKISNSARMGKVENDDRASWAMAFTLFMGNVVYIWHAAVYASQVERAITACGFNVRSQIIWVKPHIVLSRGQYHWRHEACWFAIRKQESAHWAGGRRQNTVWADIIDSWKPSDQIYAAQVDENMLVAFDASMTTVWEFGVGGDEAKTIHSTQKPLECMERPIRNHAFEFIYDPFLGSGTTLMACERQQKKCRAVEINPAYVAVAIQRWVDATAGGPVLLEG